MSLKPNRPTDAGRALGAQLVRLYEPVIAEIAAMGEPDERCATCALRPGTLPNSCETTLMDVLKCAMEGEVDFMCHDHHRKGLQCHGYFAMRFAHGGEKVVTMPFPFSYEDDPK